MLGAPSPDGRFLSGIHPESGDLLLRDLSSGIRRRIGRRAQPQEFALHSIFSRDSKTVAYAWSNAARRHELRLASVETLVERTVFKLDEEGATLQPCAFSADAKQILVLVLRAEAGPQIAFVSVETGALQPVRSLPRGPAPPRRLDLSPDGNWIVFGNSLLAADGRSREIVLAPGFAGDLSPVFSRDGRRVFFHSTRDEIPALWTMPMVIDRKPVVLRAGPGPDLVIQGIASSGLLYYGVRVGVGNVYEATFDATAGKLILAPAPIGEDTAARPPVTVSGRFRSKGKELWRGSDEAPLATFGRDITALAASPDGESVAVAQGTTLTVLAPGKARAESRAASDSITGLLWAPSGRHLITVQNDMLWWWPATLESRQRILRAPAPIGSVIFNKQATALQYTAGRILSEVWSIDVNAR
jgi:hypothetical protein